MQNFKEILRYLRALHRHRYLFICITLVVMTAIGVLSFTLPRKYSADTTVFIEKNVIDSLVSGIAVSPDIDDRIRVFELGAEVFFLFFDRARELGGGGDRGDSCGSFL